MDLTWRPATLADLEAIVRVYAEMADVDHPTWAETAEEIREELTMPWVDPHRDTRLVFDGERPVALGQIYCTGTGETAIRAYVWGGVVPEYRGRGIGRALLDWEIATAREILDAIETELPRQISGHAQAGSDRIGLFERAGMHPIRYYFTMRRDLAEPIPAIALPDGLRFAEWTADRDESVRAMKNEAFRDHPGSQPSPPEQWRAMLEQSTTRRDLSQLVVDAADRVVGHVLQIVVGEDFERQGYAASTLQLIGVAREWRGRGVASAMISQALRAAGEAGLEQALLNVDAANPTGALAVYERMGFRVVERTQAHHLEY